MQQTQSSGTELTVLPVAERAALVLNSTATKKHLAELVAASKNILTVSSTDERMEAHRAGMALKKARTTIKDTGKTAREDAQAFAKAVIAEENTLIAIIQPEEDRVLSLRDGYDAKVAAEKAEADRIERERVTGIKAKIAGLLNLAATSYRDTAAELRATLDDLAQFELNEADFGEFVGDAAEAKAQALAGLQDLHAKAEASEAAAAKLEAERAELQRIQAAAVLARQEEEARQAAEAQRLKAEREAFEAERRKFEEEKAARAAAEQLESDHFQALLMNELHDAERLERDHEEALAMNAMWAALDAGEKVTVADTDELVRLIEDQPADADLNECGEPLAELVELVEPERDVDAEMKAGIEALCAAVRDLTELGMDGDHILFTVGEALDAINAKEAA